MTTYSVEEFINSILRNSFQQKHYVDKAQLNRIAYQAAREIFNSTGQKVIDEGFEVNFSGPSLSCVNVYYLQVHDGRTVREYMNNSFEHPRFIQDENIEKIILQVWNRVKCMPLYLILSTIPTKNFPLTDKSDNELLLVG